MPLNPDGTPEIRALFAAVDALADTSPLVTVDGNRLTDRGRKVQRNYVNWRAKKLVPVVLRNSPPKQGDAAYFARFLKLTDGKWLPNRATVRHIFAEGRTCPSECLREALGDIGGSIKFVDAEDPEGIASGDLIGAMIEQIQSNGRGNKKNWRETTEGTRARTLEDGLRNSPAMRSVNESFVDEGVNVELAMANPRPAMAQLLAALFSGLSDQDVDPRLFDADADLVEPVLFTSLLQAAGIDPTEVPSEVGYELGDYMKEAAKVIGRIIRRLNTNPESITESIRKVRTRLILGARLMPPLAAPFGIRATSDEPRDHAFLDTLIIFVAAYVTEKAASD